MKRWGLLLCGVMVTGLSCSRTPQKSAEQFVVFVSIPPQKFFAEKISTPKCSVRCLIPEGASPHTYEPRPQQMAELAHSRLYFSVGIEMEEVWLPRIRKINPHLKIVATDSGISKLPMTQDLDGHEKSEMEADHVCDRHHSGNDPHIWLAPSLVKVQMRAMARAFISVDSANSRWYRRRLVEAEASIDSLEQQIKKQLLGCTANSTFLTFHPSWGYFADAFSLRQVAIEVEGKEPGPRQLGEIITYARKMNCRTVFVQPQFSRRAAEMIAEQLHGTVVVVNPLAGEWDRNLLQVAGKLCE